MKKITPDFSPPRKCAVSHVNWLAHVARVVPQIPFILLMLIPMIVKSQTMMEVQLNPTLYNGAYHIRCNGGRTVIVEGNGITGATSDFTARKEIHINDEFHAQYGSEVHIFPSTVFPDCPDYSGYRTSSQYSSSIKYQSTNEKWIELLFKLGNEVADVQAIPNPTNGYCMVRITETDSFKGELILTDMAGRNIFSKNVNALSEQLNLSYLSKGIYYLEIINSSQVFN